MKLHTQLLRGFFLLSFILTACGTPGSPTQIPLPAPAQITETITVEPIPSDVPFEMVSLDIQPPVVGTTMHWVDGSVLVYVPEGPFLMGGNKKDNPEHTVTLSPYWIYQTKVTNRMYGLCVDVGVCTPPLDKQAVIDMSSQYLLDRPIVDVNWEQAQGYCGWVEGLLPTEAQWEKAARGPDGNIYPWGAADPSCDLLNFNGCLGKTSRVFDYLDGRSYYSAYDMAGNTFEWTNDRYDAYYYPNGPDINPPGPATGTRRVVRGSNFSSKNADVPVSLRFLAPPEDHRSDLGFRCVVEQPRVFAPYCQTSVFLPGDANVPPPSRSCDVSQNFITRGCRFVNHEIVGAGELRGVSGAPVLECSVVGANTVSCSGLPSTTGVVTAVVVCGTLSPGDRPADPSCLIGYEPVPGSEVSCEIVPDPSGSTGCPPGETLFEDGAGGTSCGRLRRIEIEEERPEPVGGPDPATGCFPGMDLVTGSDGTPICRASLPGGRTVECPPGTIPRPTSADTYACFDPVTMTRVEVPCSSGEYLAGEEVCVGTPPEGGLTEENSCLAGFTYDAALGCCQAPGGVYPGCAEGEYYDSVHGCQPRPDASGAIVTIISFSASTGACGGGSIPEDPDKPGGSPCDGITESATCATIAGCHFDGVLKVCVPD